jgi:hypothetical protein
MADLDQGGTSRQWIETYLGPSIGWTPTPAKGSSLAITIAGTYNIDLSTTYVTVNVAGAVTVVLPSALNPAAGGVAVPGPFVDAAVVIADIGGNAQANPITIQPSVGDTIMSLASIRITVNYGAYTLSPNAVNRTWNSISP